MTLAADCDCYRSHGRIDWLGMIATLSEAGLTGWQKIEAKPKRFIQATVGPAISAKDWMNSGSARLSAERRPHDCRRRARLRDQLGGEVATAIICALRNTHHAEHARKRQRVRRPRPPPPCRKAGYTAPGDRTSRFINSAPTILAASVTRPRATQHCVYDEHGRGQSLHFTFGLLQIRAPIYWHGPKAPLPYPSSRFPNALRTNPPAHENSCGTRRFLPRD